LGGRCDQVIIRNQDRGLYSGNCVWREQCVKVFFYRFFKIAGAF